MRPKVASDSNYHNNTEVVRPVRSFNRPPSLPILSSPLMATVRIHFPENESPTVLNLTGSRISVGRLPHNRIQIIDRTISALHAEFIREGDHYRLHDRGSSNGTFVNGEAITDYHLREACRISFGVFECEFSPAVGPTEAEDSLENLPSRGEINEVRHENAKLRNQLQLLQEEVETLSKAPSADAESGAETVPRGEFVRIVGEMEKLKEALLRSEEEVKRLKNDLGVLQRDRGNLQRAWDDAKAELMKLRLTPTPLGGARATPAEEPATEPVEVDPVEAEESAATVGVTQEEERALLPFKPAAKPSIQSAKPFVPATPQAQPGKVPTVTQPQPFAPAAAPKAQAGSGSGIRPFPKANPPAPASNPALAGAGPLAHGTQAKPLPLSPIKPFAKEAVGAPATAGPKGTQKISIPPKH